MRFSNLTGLLVIFIFSFQLVVAQSVSINGTGAAADAQSILDISSTNKGVLLPRMTTAQRTSFSPTNGSDNGMLVYDTNTESFWYWDGTANVWREVPNTSNTGDITSVTAGAGLAGGGTTGNVTLDARANNGLNVDATADQIQLGGPLTETTTISLGGFDMTYDLSSIGNFVIQDGGVPHFQIDNNDGNAFLGADLTIRDGSTVGTTLIDLTDAGLGGNDGLLRIYTDGLVNHTIAGDGDVIFNDQGIDRDFRIESDNESNMFRIDAGLDRIGIGIGTPTAQLHTTGTLRFANYSNGYLQVDGSGNVSTVSPGSLFTAGTGLSWSGTTLNSVWTQSGNDIYNNNTSNVGIGTSSPSAKLQVTVNEGSGNSIPVVLRNQGALNNNGTGVGIGFNVHNAGSIPKTAIYNERLGDFGAPSKLHILMSTVADAATSVALSDSRMTILSTGNVGVGTTAPTEKLHVAGDVKINGSGSTIGGSNINNAWLTIGDNASSGVGIDNNEIYFTGIDANFGVLGSNSLSVNVNGSTRMFFQTNGNIGVGTNSPAQKFDVVGDVNVSSGFRIGNTAAAGEFLRGNGTRFVSSAIQVTDLPTIPAAGGWTDDGSVVRLTTSTDNVGIGTTSTSAKLHVVGTPSGDGTWDESGAIFENTGTAGEAAVAFKNSETGADYWIQGVNQSAHYDIAYGAVFTNGNTFLRIQNNGFMGLGTVSPSTQLHTTGGVRFQGLGGSGVRFVVADANGNLSATSSTASGIVTGTGTTNYLARWTPNGSTIGTGVVYDNGTNVGVSTTAPEDKLHVAGNIRHTGFMVSRGGTYSSTWMQFDQDVNGNSLILGAGGLTALGSGESASAVRSNIAASTETLYLSSDGGTQFVTGLQSGWGFRIDAMTILSNGNVGIGTTTPGSLLDVEDDTQLPISLQRTGNVGDVGIEFRDNDANAQTGYFSFNHRDGSSQSNGSSFHFTTTEASMGLIIDGPGGYYASSQLALRSNGNSYFNGGNVGIGTTGPTERLHVYSNADASIYLEADADNATESDNPYLKMTQDGQLVNSIIGMTGADGVDPEGNTYTASLNNGLLIGTTTANAPLQLGTSNSARITVAVDGKVGLLTNSPISDLDIAQSGGSATAQGTGGINLRNAQYHWRIYNSNDYVRFNYSSDSGTNYTPKAYVNSANGAWTTVSDSRMKKDIIEVGSVLDKVEKLRPVSYHYIDNDASDMRSIGFLAQDVREIFPEAVSQEEEGDLLGIDYSLFSVIAIKAIQEQQKIIEQGNEERKNLQEQIDELRSALEKLMNK